MAKRHKHKRSTAPHHSPNTTTDAIITKMEIKPVEIESTKHEQIEKDEKLEEYVFGDFSQIGDEFYAEVTPTNGPILKDIFKINEKKITDKNVIWTLAYGKNILYVDNPKKVKVLDLNEELKKEQEARKKNKKTEESKVNLLTMEPEDKLNHLAKAGIRNFWMVGPAGCGKSTIARMVATKNNLPYYCISCGVGTSAVEFTGYKYPIRESTKFAEYYAKPSIILIDEMTALDPAVGQVLNAALANGELETTTGLVKRHPDCIIIATSNTFGNGASRQYVANNQLDASTIDRFVGGIIEVDYSEKYESQYDHEVRNFVNELRQTIKTNELRRVASTRLLQSGHLLKHAGVRDWKETLIIPWTDDEKKLIKNDFSQKIAA